MTEVTEPAAETKTLFCVFQKNVHCPVILHEVIFRLQTDGSYEASGLEDGSRLFLREGRVTSYPFSNLFPVAMAVEEINCTSGVLWTASRELATIVQLAAGTYYHLGRSDMANLVKDNISMLVG